ncbi:AI-2E family transporter [Swingsia samuiensis]|uniref:AI-2E family transporter n=1 Tax=Swingsia samuiensis TaxID=1293412 RepID=A0A4Y6UF67_9PROT|nr:AI-2E family transporter [Swingsia samuiensis]QDH16189.1 AI-2E family transporter [Swingsia samuiensis]
MTTERIILGFVLIGIAYGCGIILWPFLSAILWASILVFTSWPIYHRLRLYVRPTIAAIGMMCLSAITIIIPFSVLTTAGINDIPDIITTINNFLIKADAASPPPAWLTHLPFIGSYIVKEWGLITHDMGTATGMIRPYFGQIAQITLTILLKLAGGLFDFIMALFIAFFLWLKGDTLGQTLTTIVTRIAGPTAAPRLINVIGRTVRGTVYGVLGTAIIQGILTGIGLVITGVPAPVLLAGIAAFVAVFPIGAPLVWVPAALWLGMTHHVGYGLFLAIYGITIISGADHLIRPAFISRGAQLPYLLTVIGVLGGVLAFGGLGIFLGPVLLAVGYTLTSEFSHSPHPSKRLSDYTPDEH